MDYLSSRDIANALLGGKACNGAFETRTSHCVKTGAGNAGIWFDNAEFQNSRISSVLIASLMYANNLPNMFFQLHHNPNPNYHLGEFSQSVPQVKYRLDNDVFVAEARNGKSMGEILGLPEYWPFNSEYEMSEKLYG